MRRDTAKATATANRSTAHVPTTCRKRGDATQPIVAVQYTTKRSSSKALLVRPVRDRDRGWRRCHGHVVAKSFILEPRACPAR